jgi:hypothetical protein
MIWIVLGLGCIHWLTYRQVLRRWWRELPDWAFASAYGVANAVVLLMIHYEAEPFIYFQL